VYQAFGDTDFEIFVGTDSIMIELEDVADNVGSIQVEISTDSEKVDSAIFSANAAFNSYTFNHADSDSAFEINVTLISASGRETRSFEAHTFARDLSFSQDLNSRKSFVLVGEKSLEVHWPQEGNIRPGQIGWRLVIEEEKSEKEVYEQFIPFAPDESLKTIEQFVSLSKLQSNFDYVISIHRQFESTASILYRAISARTLSQSIVNSARVQATIARTAFKLRWKSNGLGDEIASFRIDIFDLGSQTKSNFTIPATSSSFLFNSASPATAYAFKIRAVTSSGFIELGKGEIETLNYMGRLSSSELPVKMGFVLRGRGMIDVYLPSQNAFGGYVTKWSVQVLSTRDNSVVFNSTINPPSEDVFIPDLASDSPFAVLISGFDQNENMLGSQSLSTSTLPLAYKDGKVNVLIDDGKLFVQWDGISDNPDTLLFDVIFQSPNGKTFLYSLEDGNREFLITEANGDGPFSVEVVELFSSNEKISLGKVSSIFTTLQDDYRIAVVGQNELLLEWYLQPFPDQVAWVVKINNAQTGEHVLKSRFHVRPQQYRYSQLAPNTKYRVEIAAESKAGRLIDTDEFDVVTLESPIRSENLTVLISDTAFRVEMNPHGDPDSISQYSVTVQTGTQTKNFLADSNSPFIDYLEALSDTTYSVDVTQMMRDGTSISLGSLSFSTQRKEPFVLVSDKLALLRWFGNALPDQTGWWISLSEEKSGALVFENLVDLKSRKYDLEVRPSFGYEMVLSRLMKSDVKVEYSKLVFESLERPFTSGKLHVFVGMQNFELRWNAPPSEGIADDVTIYISSPSSPKTLSFIEDPSDSSFLFTHATHKTQYSVQAIQHFPGNINKTLGAIDFTTLDTSGTIPSSAPSRFFEAFAGPDTVLIRWNLPTVSSQVAWVVTIEDLDRNSHVARGRFRLTNEAWRYDKLSPRTRYQIQLLTQDSQNVTTLVKTVQLMTLNAPYKDDAVEVLIAPTMFRVEYSPEPDLIPSHFIATVTLPDGSIQNITLPSSQENFEYRDALPYKVYKVQVWQVSTPDVVTSLGALEFDTSGQLPSFHPSRFFEAFAGSNEILVRWNIASLSQSQVAWIVTIDNVDVKAHVARGRFHLNSEAWRYEKLTPGTRYAIQLLAENEDKKTSVVDSVELETLENDYRNDAVEVLVASTKFRVEYYPEVDLTPNQFIVALALEDGSNQNISLPASQLNFEYHNAAPGMKFSVQVLQVSTNGVVTSLGSLRFATELRTPAPDATYALVNKDSLLLHWLVKPMQEQTNWVVYAENARTGELVGRELLEKTVHEHRFKNLDSNTKYRAHILAVFPNREVPRGHFELTTSVRSFESQSLSAFVAQNRFRVEFRPEGDISQVESFKAIVTGADNTQEFLISKAVNYFDYSPARSATQYSVEIIQVVSSSPTKSLGTVDLTTLAYQSVALVNAEASTVKWFRDIRDGQTGWRIEAVNKKTLQKVLKQDLALDETSIDIPTDPKIPYSVDLYRMIKDIAEPYESLSFITLTKQLADDRIIAFVGTDTWEVRWYGTSDDSDDVILQGHLVSIWVSSEVKPLLFRLDSFQDRFTYTSAVGSTPYLVQVSQLFSNDVSRSLGKLKFVTLDSNGEVPRRPGLIDSEASCFSFTPDALALVGSEKAFLKWTYPAESTSETSRFSVQVTEDGKADPTETRTSMMASQCYYVVESLKPKSTYNAIIEVLESAKPQAVFSFKLKFETLPKESSSDSKVDVFVHPNHFALVWNAADRKNVLAYDVNVKNLVTGTLEKFTLPGSSPWFLYRSETPLQEYETNVKIRAQDGKLMDYATSRIQLGNSPKTSAPKPDPRSSGYLTRGIIAAVSIIAICAIGAVALILLQRYRQQRSPQFETSLLHGAELTRLASNDAL